MPKAIILISIFLRCARSNSKGRHFLHIWIKKYMKIN
jgi:hypothetical protein